MLGLISWTHYNSRLSYCAFLALLLAVAFIAACAPVVEAEQIVIVVPVSSTPRQIVLAPTTPPTPTLTPSPTHTPAPSATPAGWITVAEGVQVRDMRTSSSTRSEPVYALRLDPSRVDIELRHDQEQPRSIDEWFSAEQPIAAMNAGFFDPDFSPVGLWVIDDVTMGRGHHSMQAEFRVSGAGISILRVSERYKSDGTRVIASVESYPLLIRQDGLRRRGLSFRRPAARLVVAIDGADHVLFILFPSNTFSLNSLANWLERSDLNLKVALNLDGGSSAGMLVRSGDALWGEDSGREVPGAFVVLPKVLGVSGSGGSP